MGPAVGTSPAKRGVSTSLSDCQHTFETHPILMSFIWPWPRLAPPPFLLRHWLTPCRLPYLPPRAFCGTPAKYFFQMSVTKEICQEDERPILGGRVPHRCGSKENIPTREQSCEPHSTRRWLSALCAGGPPLTITQPLLPFRDLQRQ
ncbi:unnamed protein product [Merluccius merluccius]